MKAQCPKRKCHKCGEYGHLARQCGGASTANADKKRKWGEDLCKEATWV